MRRRPICLQTIPARLWPGLVVAALGVGCAHLPTCPAKGGPAWNEWTSPHFRLMTDVTDEAVAEHLATQLEQFRSAILATAWREVPEPTDLLEVIALRSAFETEAVLAPRTVAEFAHFGGMNFVLTSATEHIDRAKTLKHEIVHALMHQLGLDRNAPVWFAEGIAEYLATTELDDGTNKVTFGSSDPDYLRAVHRLGLASWDELWAPSAVGMEKCRQVATSWLLVHYLFNHERERFRRYQAGLATAKNAKSFWKETFPELGADGLIDRLSAYSNDGQYVKYVAQMPSPHFGFVQHGIPDAEVHAILGLLHFSAHFHDDAARANARREIGEALREDPLNVRARYVERVLLVENTRDVSAAEALTRAHPDDWRSWLVLAVAHASLRHEAELKAAFTRARALGLIDESDLKPAAAAPY